MKETNGAVVHSDSSAQTSQVRRVSLAKRGRAHMNPTSRMVGGVDLRGAPSRQPLPPPLTMTAQASAYVRNDICSTSGQHTDIGGKTEGGKKTSWTPKVVIRHRSRQARCDETC